MRKKQEHFTPSDDHLISDIEEIRKRSKMSSLSQMIDILLHQAVKERNRKKKKNVDTPS